MPSNHLILCRPLLLLPSIFPSIRVFSNDENSLKFENKEEISVPGYDTDEPWRHDAKELRQSQKDENHAIPLIWGEIYGQEAGGGGLGLGERGGGFLIEFGKMKRVLEWDGGGVLNVHKVHT